MTSSMLAPRGTVMIRSLPVALSRARIVTISRGAGGPARCAGGAVAVAIGRPKSGVHAAAGSEQLTLAPATPDQARVEPGLPGTRWRASLAFLRRWACDRRRPSSFYVILLFGARLPVKKMIFSREHRPEQGGFSSRRALAGDISRGRAQKNKAGLVRRPCSAARGALRAARPRPALDTTARQRLTDATARPRQPRRGTREGSTGRQDHCRPAGAAPSTGPGRQ